MKTRTLFAVVLLSTSALAIPPKNLDSPVEVPAGDLIALIATLKLLNHPLRGGWMEADPVVFTYERGKQRLVGVIKGKKDSVDRGREMIGKVPLAVVSEAASSAQLVIDVTHDVVLIYKHGDREIVRLEDGRYSSP